MRTTGAYCKKFLVRGPLNWGSKFKLHKLNCSETARILIQTNGELQVLQRRSFYNQFSRRTESIYSMFSSCDTFRDTKISMETYYDMCATRKTGSTNIAMDVYTIVYDHYAFILEIYAGSNKGLMILNQIYTGDLHLPVFLDIDKEITHDINYSNYNLFYRNSNDNTEIAQYI